MSGHVFVTRTDLTALACDVWLLPGSNTSGPTTRESWLDRSPQLRKQFEGKRLINPDLVRGTTRVWRIRREDGPRSPQVYLMNSGGPHGSPLDWYVSGLQEFLSALRSEREHWVADGNRARPLVGIPMFGTGAGGARHSKGAMIKAVLAVLADAAADPALGSDFAFVTLKEADFTAAQWARKRLAEERDMWRDLDDSDLRDLAADLGGKARAGELVLFMGAGVSAGAGLPLWDALIARLARRAGMAPEDRDQLKQKLPIADQARIIELELKRQNDLTLGEAVAQEIAADRVSLSHTLLAALPVREIATTNYDDLFERASEAAGRPAAQLPYAPDATRERWVLKLHGSVERPEDIVLTRHDYLAYDEKRAALAGIVQGLLITKHMLFVGFSFADDNFHRIAHDVRNAVRPDPRRDAPRRFGTAVLLNEDPLRARLWEGELRFASTAVPGAGAASTPKAIRRLEIFLDRMLSEATTASRHLLDAAYDELLNDEERRLRDALRSFLSRARPHDPALVPAWAEIENLARSLGTSEPATTAASGSAVRQRQ